MSSDAELEESLRRDRLRRQRFVAVLITAVCALVASFYYVLFANWPAPIKTVEGQVLTFQMIWMGWVRATWIGAVVVIVGVTNLVRAIVLTVAIRR